MFDIIIFIFTGLVMYQVLRFIKWMRSVRQFQRDMNRTWQDVFNQFGGNQPEGNRHSMPGAPDIYETKPQPRKIFDEFDGEYTEFEEVPDQEQK